MTYWKSRALMTSIPLGLLLQDSLDAAFCGEIFYGPEEIAQWGREIIGFLQEGLPGQNGVQENLWGLARRLIKDLMMDYRGPEMLAQVFENPGAFFRSVLLMYYGGLPEETITGWKLPRYH
jgi:hypothetical protein